MSRDELDTSGASTGLLLHSRPASPSRDERRGPIPGGPHIRPTAGNIATDDEDNLCTTCAYGDECMYRGTAKTECESFDVDVTALSTLVNDRSEPEPHNEEPLDPRGGLCCNCMLRERCTICRSGGAVWHCEEYC
jgi:hypothetical protein